MVSIMLKHRMEESQLTKDSIKIIQDEGGNNWYQIPVWLKKIDKNLFAEYSFEDLPERIKNQIEKMDNCEESTLSDVIPDSAKERAILKAGKDTYSQLKDLYNNNEPEKVY